MSATERERLERVAEWYRSRDDFDYHLIKYGMRVLRQHAAGPRVLEMGCADGVMTEELVTAFPEVEVVDGSAAYIEETRRRVSSSVTFHLALFEEFVPEGTFNSIIMARALEHVEDPVAVLRRAATWLARGGAIHVVVPNAESLHRRIGQAMGLIHRLDELHERDLRAGHRRVYNVETLRRDVEAAGLRLDFWTGIFLKPLSNDQMRTWPQPLLDALFEVGRELPAYCAEIYAMCQPAPQG